MVLPYICFAKVRKYSDRPVKNTKNRNFYYRVYVFEVKQVIMLCHFFDAGEKNLPQWRYTGKKYYFCAIV